jgi:hypothetical protein
MVNSPGSASAATCGQFDNMPQHNRRSVRGNFYYVVCSVRVRLREKSNHCFVNVFARGRFNHFAKDGPACGKLMLQAQHRTGNRTCLWTSKANHANAAPTRRRSNCDDGVVEVHRSN